MRADYKNMRQFSLIFSLFSTSSYTICSNHRNKESTKESKAVVGGGGLSMREDLTDKEIRSGGKLRASKPGR